MINKYKVRPTTGKIIKSIFDILQNYQLNGHKFIDLFCGTGRVGIEAYKKGFDVTAVEKNNRQFLKIKKLFLTKNFKIKLIKKDAVKFLKNLNESSDVFYLDPPYEKIELYEECLKIIFNNKLLADNGVIILEKNPRITLQNDFGKYNAKNYVYGDTELVVIG